MSSVWNGYFNYQLLCNKGITKTSSCSHDDLSQVIDKGNPCSAAIGYPCFQG